MKELNLFVGFPIHFLLHGKSLPSKDRDPNTAYGKLRMLGLVYRCYFMNLKAVYTWRVSPLVLDDILGYQNAPVVAFM